MIKDDRFWFGVNDDAVPAIKRFLSEVQQGKPPKTIWPYGKVGHKQDARNEIKKLFDDDSDFSTPKPEKLMQRIVHLGSDEGDLVLDFFAGSGTTGAVAHKMNRQYILCEQMDYVEPVTIKRLQKVIDGEQGASARK